MHPATHSPIPQPLGAESRHLDHEPASTVQESAPSDSACQTKATRQLTPVEREFAIEQAELLEIRFEQQGRHTQAVYAAHLKKQLIALRNTGDKQ